MSREDLKAAMTRLTECVENDKAHWRLDDACPVAVDVIVDDLRLVLSALSTRESDAQSGNWQSSPATDLEQAIAEFKATLPGWWYMVCECQVSCDASCAPTSESHYIDWIEGPGDPFDAGFHADLPQPSSLATALREVMAQALHAIAGREAQYTPASTANQPQGEDGEDG